MHYPYLWLKVLKLSFELSLKLFIFISGPVPCIARYSYIQIPLHKSKNFFTSNSNKDSAFYISLFYLLQFHAKAFSLLQSFWGKTFRSLSFSLTLNFAENTFAKQLLRLLFFSLIRYSLKTFR